MSEQDLSEIISIIKANIEQMASSVRQCLEGVNMIINIAEVRTSDGRTIHPSED